VIASVHIADVGIRKSLGVVRKAPSPRRVPGLRQANRAKPFHRQSAFVRFRPDASEGHLDGKNPLAESWLARA
jgi:hypothetical protein